MLQKIIEAEQLDELQCKPGTAEGFFIFDANAACVDFNPLDIESVVEWIVVEWVVVEWVVVEWVVVEWVVVEWVVVEQAGLYELRFALVIGCVLAFRCVFFFGDPLDAATGAVFQLTEVSDDSLTRPLGGAIRFHQGPVREFFAVRFFVAWFDEHEGIVSGNDGLSSSFQGNFS